MSERFVRGWKVSLEKLHALVAEGQLRAEQVLSSPSNAKCIEDVSMAIGRGDAAKGKRLASEALSSIFDNNLRPTDATLYARTMELLLNCAARPLAIAYEADLREPTDQILMQSSYAVPNDSHARWNPILELCSLPRLAKAWGAANFSFPWATQEAPDKGPYPWPLLTTIDAADLSAIASEIRTLTQTKLADIPDGVLGDNGEWAEHCRSELWSNLQRLASWLDIARSDEPAERLALAKKGNSLVLLMDGDQ